jgi:hypothetical protein
VIVKTLDTTPAGETHWSTRTMVANAGMSHTAIGRIWRTFGLTPHVTESFKISPDPQLIEKVRAISNARKRTRANPGVRRFFRDAATQGTVSLGGHDRRAAPGR